MTERLYRYEVDTDPALLQPGPMIVAFDGFFDAGMAQRLLVDHLLGRATRPSSRPSTSTRSSTTAADVR